MFLLRTIALGVATGGRTTAGITAVTLTAGRREPRGGGALGLLAGPRAHVVVPVLAAGELVADKLPKTPSRTEPGGLLARAVTAALAAAALAERAGRSARFPAVLAAGTAVGAAYAGRRWRAFAQSRGWPDPAAAVAEDLTAAGLAWAAVRG